MSRSPLLRLLWLLSALFIVYGTTIPFDFVADRQLAIEKLSLVTLNPLVSPDTGRRISVPDVVQNLLLFVPFGILGMAVLGPRLSWALRLVLLAGLAAALSTFVEALQLFTADRTSSLSDVVANTAGALAGGVAGVTTVDVFRRAVRILRELGVAEPPAFYPTMVAVMVVCIAAWEPFDVTLDVGSIWWKLKALGGDPWQSGVPGDEAVQVLRYAWCALLMSAWLTQMDVRASLSRAVIACSLVGIALEGSQLLIGARMPSLESALVNVAGALAGGLLWIVVPRIRSPQLWVPLLAAAIWLGAAMQLLSPFSVSPEYKAFLWMPFLGQYANTTTETLSHTFELVLLYFPLGFALPWVTTRARLYPAAMLLAAAMAFPLEYFQGWIVGRFPDVTGVMLAMLGALAGAWTGGAGWTRFRAAIARRDKLSSQRLVWPPILDEPTGRQKPGQFVGDQLVGTRCHMTDIAEVQPFRSNGGLERLEGLD